MIEDSDNVYATAVCLYGVCVLLIGPSGSGKSDLALRLIENKKAMLVADDRVILTKESRILTACAPQNLSGLLEVRGVGIVQMPVCAKADVAMCVRLVQDAKNVERMPDDEYESFLGIDMPCLRLYPFEASAPDKVVIKLKAVLAKMQKTA